MEFHLFITLLFGSLLHSCHLTWAVEHNSSYLRLYKDLFTGYNKEVRPVLNHRDTVNVEIYAWFIQLIDLDEPAQVFMGKWYMHMKWQDEYLVWNKADYDGIERVEITADRIWTPDIKLASSVDPKKPVIVIDRRTTLRVYYNGYVDWDPILILKSGCDIKINDFPFDEQNCPVELSPWLYSAEEVSYNMLINKSVPLHDAVRHSLWDVMLQNCSKENIGQWNDSMGIPNTYEKIICTVKLHRKSLFYIFNMLIPIMVLLVIGGASFLMPVNDGGRIGLSVTVLLSMTVFLMLIMNNLPVSSDGVPHLQIFIALTMILLGSSTLATVIVLKMYNFSTGDPGTGDDPRGHIHKPPTCFVNLYLKVLSKVVLLDSSAELRLFNMAKEKQIKRKDQNGVSLIANGTDGEKPEVEVLGRKRIYATEEEDDEFICKAFKKVWIEMACVLDRLCFLGYVICALCLIIFAFSKSGAGHIKDH